MRIVYVCGLVIVFMCSAKAQFAHDLRLLEETSRSAIIEFTPNYLSGIPEEQVVLQEGTISFFGNLVESAEPGNPILYYRAATLAIPSKRYSLQVVAAEYGQRDGVSQPIAPAFESDKEMGLVRITAQRNQASTSTDPHQLAEIVGVTPYDDYFLGTLKLYPVEYSADGRSARVYTRIIVRLEFDAGEKISTVDHFIAEINAKPMPKLQRSTIIDSPLAQGDWYKLDIAESGIYKLDSEFFTSRGITVGNINSIRIYGNDGTSLPEDVVAPRPDGLVEIPRYVVDSDNDNLFDAGDAVFFYGKSTRGWTYNPTQKTFNHYINYYTETNSYFLTFGGTLGLEMDSLASLNSPSPHVPQHFQQKLFVEEELFNHGGNGLSSGRQWWGKTFDTETRSHTFTNLLNDIVTTEPVTYRYVFLSRSATVDTFRITENGIPIGNPVFTSPTNLQSIEGLKYYRTPVFTVTHSGQYPDERSVLRFTFGLSSSSALGWVDWFEVLYRSEFNAVNDVLSFTSPDTNAVVEYQLSGFSNRETQVFDVTDFRDVRRIVNLDIPSGDPTVCTFQANQIQGGVSEFIAVGANGYKTPAAVTKLANSNLHGEPTGADFVIISPAEFIPAANRLKAHREQPGDDYLKTIVVDVESIFNEFSSGVLDPMAIRDFLRYASTNWALRPQYVLLFGDGSYDYKDNLNRQIKENWIIPFESLNSVHQIESYASDDQYILLEPNSLRVSMAMGRLPVQSLSEADSVVSKIIRYETELPFGAWRNRITFVADDGLTSTRDEFSLHTGQAELLAQSYTPASFDRRKIFIVEYPTTLSTTGRRKPTANNSIVDAINNGTLIINYTGHGNTEWWSHEYIFAEVEDLPKLTNVDRLCLLVASTCDYARWDLPSDRSAGEKIVADMSGGAIAVVTAIRSVYSDNNSLFNNTLFSYLFAKDSLSRPPRIGDAMKATKQLLIPAASSTRERINHFKYHLLGDPTVRLAVPRLPAAVDTVAGAPAADTVSIQTLGRTTLNGRVMSAGGTTSTGFTGTALVEVFDTKRAIAVPEWGSFTFQKNGSLLYRGEVSVTGGIYQAEFPIPKDVSYNPGNARISVYAWDNNIDGVGFTETVRIEGTDTTAVVDTAGPLINVYLDSESFRSGDVVKPDAILIVELFDSSGINTSTAGIGHRLEAVLSTQQQPIDLTDFYRGNLDTFRSGTVVYPLNGLQEGRHSLTLRAWDIHNNSARVDAYFEVRAASDAAIYNVLNFPNPFSNTTTFTFQRNSFEPVDVEIKIYTLAGRLIESITVPSVADRFVQVPWNGRDRDGNELANGVYFYKVITRSFDRSRSIEVLGKLTVLR
ncbi:MAG: type IX secretion system sortase PorU [Ignavibacteriae bacterium]|nr:type IX secretion system sortase PorU [Ignavibacteriota bacterium]